MNRGGSETMIMNLYRNVDRSKIQFDFVKHTGEKCAYDDEIISLGGRIFSAPNFKIYNIFKYKKWWRNFFKDHPEYKVVHGHLFTIASVFFDVAHEFGLVCIGHSHATKSPILSLKTLLRKPFINRLSKTSDYRFACSEDAGQWIYGKSSFTVLKNAIDSQQYIYSEEKRALIRKEFSLDGEFVVGNIGRLTEQKNQSFVIDVFAKFYQKYPNSVLIIVGVGKLENFLKNKVDSLGLSGCVRFTGARSDIPSILSAMDLFIFPSLFEGLGIVAVEAQAAGLKTICSDRVPREAKVSNLIEYLSLEAPMDVWVDRMLDSCETSERMNMRDNIITEGYDIKTTSEWLQNFYLKLK
ncbi:MAG: glycosyltransferase family 1 protein [Fibrobacter sp.]|nr:glycosyltransferase family 1 protein [Fibrobacter sp.]